jgi:hypothetical protein
MSSVPVKKIITLFGAFVVAVNGYARASGAEYDDMIGLQGNITIIEAVDLKIRGINIAEGAQWKWDNAEICFDQEISQYYSYSVMCGYSGIHRHAQFGPADAGIMQEDIAIMETTENGMYVSELEMNINPAPGHNIIAGCEYSDYERSDSNPGLTRRNGEHCNIPAFFFQYDRETGFFEFSAGLRGERWDFFEEWGFFPWAGLILRAASGISLQNTVTVGFKAPRVSKEDEYVGLSDMRAATNLAVHKTAPEADHSWSYSSDITVVDRSGQFGAGLTIGGFYTSIEYTRGFDHTREPLPDLVTPGMPKNGDGPAKSFGGNLQFEFSYEGIIRINSGWTYQAARYENQQTYDNGKYDEVPGVPRLYGFSMVQLFSGGMQFTFSCQYTGKKYTVHDGVVT